MRLALYAHYGRAAEIARHVIHHLQALRDLGFEILFISNSPLSDASNHELSSLCCERVIQRPNTGFDFSMWKAGLRAVNIGDLDELLLTNSSIVGPLRPLQPLWEDPRLRGCDFWGLTDNSDLASHLQSYFLVFNSRVIHSECFSLFWKAVLPYTDKMQVIRSYEIGLTSWLGENGFRWKALFPLMEIAKEAQRRRGPQKLWRDKLRGRQFVCRDATVYHAELLLLEGMPFLKTALLQPGNRYMKPGDAYKLLEGRGLPEDVMEELAPDVA